MRFWAIAGCVVIVGLFVATAAPAQAPAVAKVELLDGLQSGQLWAEFRGGGETMVTGVIGRTGPEPVEVQIQPGTQFWAQAGGRQGMTSTGSRSVGLTGQRAASVVIATACTNIGLDAPTPADVMVPTACPDARMAALLGAANGAGVAHPPLQLAVWAVANDPPREMIEAYLRTIIPGQGPGVMQMRLQVMGVAAGLLGAAGLDPSQFRMFR